ncbi:serine hydrolase [Xenorhabdus bovienii]|uniref:serine hydrolase n=1 Tax=Xenorhabdus bovienii TaxID=40576 RepID=UPI0021585C58|nr:serine hydrolase [Xenorhabdus bovienii]
MEKNANGRLGVVLIYTADHSIITYRGHERFPLCSTSKMMAVSALLKKSETDKDLLNQRIHYQQSDIVEYSPIRGPLGKRKLSHAKTAFCTIRYRLCVMDDISRTPA